jgi:hypothetical protein
LLTVPSLADLRNQLILAVCGPLVSPAARFSASRRFFLPFRGFAAISAAARRSGESPCGAPASTASATGCWWRCPPPYSQFEARIQQVDIRLSKNFQVSKVRMQGMFDIYNALDGSAILSENYRSGSSWLKPTEILAGRLLKFGVR